MKKSGAIYYKNIFCFLHCMNDVRLEKYRVNVVFGNFVQIFDIDDYFAFAYGRFLQQMDCFFYHKYGTSVLGGVFRLLQFSLLMQFIEIFVDQYSVLWSNWVHFNGVNFGAGFRVYG